MAGNGSVVNVRAVFNGMTSYHWSFHGCLKDLGLSDGTTSANMMREREAFRATFMKTGAAECSFKTDKGWVLITAISREEYRKSK